MILGLKIIVLSSGPSFLYSKTRQLSDVELPPVPSEHPTDRLTWSIAVKDVCQQSKTLFDACVACQAYLSYGPSKLFHELYDQVLKSIQSDIRHPQRYLNDGTLGAAILMCTIGVC